MSDVSLSAKPISGGRFAACCPFCVEHGKKKDTKYHLCIKKDHWVYCYRCNFTRPYEWFAERYSLSIVSGLRVRPEEHSDVPIKDYIDANTVKFKYPLGFCASSAMNYLISRNITKSDVECLDIRLGRADLSNRVVFVYEDRYYVGRAFLPSARIKTKNPSFEMADKPLMYLPKETVKTLYIVEGTFDMVPFVHKGLNVCCLLGKDLSMPQLKQLVSNTPKEVIVLLDPDAYEASFKVTQTLADHFPLLSIGIGVYKRSYETKDPAKFDSKLFDNFDVTWTRKINY